MAGKKVGALIKEARTQAGMTQEALAKKVKGVSASDISLAERGDKELTQAVLKEIAKVTGVTQKSLLDAAKGTSGSAKKTASGSARKTTSGSAKKTASGSTFKLSAEEKKLIQAYREADEKQKAAVRMLLLKADGLASAAGMAGHTAGAFGELLGSGDLLSSLVGSVKDLLG